jgi:hypothetical protein
MLVDRNSQIGSRYRATIGCRNEARRGVIMPARAVGGTPAGYCRGATACDCDNLGDIDVRVPRELHVAD